MTDQPNILLILTDQHRLSAVGAYGDTVCQTPHLDQFAKDGVRFETAYTACPVCSPARGTVMTGHYPHTHGITSNVHNVGCSVHELRDRPELLSRRLEAAGYQLGYSGKWHLGTNQQSSFGMENEPSLPKDVGFNGQNFPGHGGGGFNYPEYKQYLADNGFEHVVKPWAESTQDILPMGELEGAVESTVPYFLTQHTMDLMDDFQKTDQPFFMWHNFWGPHGPYFAPTEYVDRYRDVSIPEWPNYHWPSREIAGPHCLKIHPDHERLSWADWEMALRYYYAFTTLIDEQIGRLLDHLEETGLAENTVVIFAADHGETIGSHGGLTDKGWHHFEEIHRIPFMMRFPNGQWAGQVRTPFASLADLYPTVCEIAQANYDEASVHGRSLLPLVDDPNVPWRVTVVSVFGGVNNVAMSQRTLRYGQYNFGYDCGG
ncbi:MAG: sulfatase-like hydrolase/transferase, partial [Candidatus Latescibacteria bacterium]|nr:sulfatase-like hydrolase/transferase [Candidatus Latescibacterota bacterium]